MEDSKRREGGSGALAPANSSEAPSSEPQSARRRAGGSKRKANSSSLNNLSSAMFNSAPSKRFMREKAAISALQPIHTGPCTRAAAASAWAAPAASVEPEVVSVKVEDESDVNEEWKILEDSLEAEYEVIRSREAGVHVVPNHCGWFSWTKWHPLEEQALSSFFSGKSEMRSPSTYMEIRNWVVKKFRSNPNKLIEIKDLEELDIGDLDARQEVMEFLDYWGLINFHPFPQTATDSSDANVDGKEFDRANCLIEKLFQFENIQCCPPVNQKPTTPTPLTPKLFAEPTVPDDSVKPEGPSVEYHCNSCSTDCSRKRFHCQKQADFDLCTECFNDGKFGSDMSLSDFILMEPAEVPALSSGTWTDQETLLLLEALELYKENWNEIAEHVATKTRDQCILHFVQMPIEDSFLDSDDETKGGHLESEDPSPNNNKLCAPKEVPETADDKHCASESLSSSCIEEAKPEDTSEYKMCQEVDENVALKALREAFEAVGSLSEPSSEPTFADAGNPVMAMAVFLARLVGSDAATASARSSLKSLSCNSPSIDLATRHCFILEDPPSDVKDSVGSESMAFDVEDRSAQNGGIMESVDPKGVSIHTKADDLPDDHRNQKTHESVKEDSSILASSNGEEIGKSNAMKETDITTVGQPAKESPIANPSSGEPTESFLGTVKELSQATPKDLNSSGSDKKGRVVATTADDSAEKIGKSEGLVEKCAKEENPVKQSFKKNNIVETTNMEEDSIEKDAKVVPIPSSVDGSRVEAASPVKASNAIDEADLTPKNDPEISGSHGGDAINMEVQNSEEIKEDHTIDKLKRAAITTLAAAAVKAQLLAGQEEEEIKKLAAFLIDKQLRKLEIKMTLFDEMGSVTMRAKEQLERTRQKLYQERAQIIATRLGLPASHPRPMPSSMPLNRNAISFANSGPRPPLGIHSLRPSIGRPMLPFAAPSTNPFPSTTMGRGPIRPQSQDSASSVKSK
ncbi:hypothetical protein QQ045_028707 [Rhodiola kirilowii]